MKLKPFDRLTQDVEMPKYAILFASYIVRGSALSDRASQEPVTDLLPQRGATSSPPDAALPVLVAQARPTERSGRLLTSCAL